MIRKLLLGSAAAGGLLVAAAVPASATDLAVRPPPAPAFVAPVAVPVFSWTGWYIGGNAGGAWGDSRFEIIGGAGPGSANGAGPGSSNGAGPGPGPGVFTSDNDSSFLGGGQIGFNWQTGPWVWGVEGDIDGKSLTNNLALGSFVAGGAGPGPGTGTGPGASTGAGPGPSTGFTLGLTAKTRVEGSIRARGGFAFDRFLVYATGGWAIADVEVSAIGTGSAFCLAPCSDSRAVNGWTVGGGAEYALTNNVSLGVEYRYTDLGRETFNLAGNSIREEVREHQVTGRLNFKFGSLFGGLIPGL